MPCKNKKKTSHGYINKLNHKTGRQIKLKFNLLRVAANSNGKWNEITAKIHLKVGVKNCAIFRLNGLKIYRRM